MMESDKWLETLKEGDSVFVRSCGISSDHYSLDKVLRITKTMIVLEKNSTRFRRNGTAIKDFSYHSSYYLVQDNEKTREIVWLIASQNKLFSIVHSLGERRINYSSLTHEQLERLIPELTKIRDELMPQKKECETKI